MYVYLLEIVYTVENKESAEHWLLHTHHNGMLISTERYGDEILTVLASEHPLEAISQLAQKQPAISFCEEKRRALYRVSTLSQSEHTLCTFPFRAGEEWYIGPENTMYLSLQSPHPNDQQLCWLLANANITAWDDGFQLASTLV